MGNIKKNNNNNNNNNKKIIIITSYIQTDRQTEKKNIY